MPHLRPSRHTHVTFDDDHAVLCSHDDHDVEPVQCGEVIAPGDDVAVDDDATGPAHLVVEAKLQGRGRQPPQGLGRPVTGVDLQVQPSMGGTHERGRSLPYQRAQGVLRAA